MTQPAGMILYLLEDIAATIAAMDTLARAHPRPGGFTIKHTHETFLPWKADAR